MRYLKTCSLVVSAVVFLLVSWTLQVQGQEEEPTVGVLFIQAFEKNDEEGMRQLIKTRADEFPMEVKEMVTYVMSPGVAPEEQDFIMMIAGTIAKMYSEHTGDKRLLAAVRSNHQMLMERRRENALPAEGVQKLKDELKTLGDNTWRIQSVKLDSSGGLLVEIDVDAITGTGAEKFSEGFAPRIDFKKSKEAKEIVKKNLPNIKKGKISWSSMGIGLKAIFLD